MHQNDYDISTKEFVDRIFKYINENPMNEFSFTEMAAKFGISKFYMCHIFKAEGVAAVSLIAPLPKYIFI